MIIEKIFFFFNFYLFIYLWLCWFFVSVRGLSPIVASGGHSSSRCAGLSRSRPLLLRSTGSRHAGSVVVAHGPSCSAACGIFPDRGSNPCPLHWQADSQPLRHQGSPLKKFLMKELKKYTPVTPSAHTSKIGPRSSPEVRFRVAYRFRSRAALGSAASGPRWWRRSCLPVPTWPRWEGLRDWGKGEGRLKSATRPWKPGANQVPKEKSPSPSFQGFNIKLGKKKIY